MKIVSSFFGKVCYTVLVCKQESKYYREFTGDIYESV